MEYNKNIFIHNLADVNTTVIGEGTYIWQYCIILSGAKIGKNCNINCYCFIENDVIIGDNVTIKCGVHLWNGLEIEDDVFIGPNVSFTNDKYPRSKEYLDFFLRTKIKKGASIGAGSVVTKDIPSGELWFGNPAKFIRKIDNRKW